MGRMDAEHGDVGEVIDPHHLRLHRGAVDQPDLDVAAIADDVAIGDDEAGGVDDEARARIDGLLRPLAELVAEELLEGRATQRRGQGAQRIGRRDGLGDDDVDHPRQHPAHQGREGGRAVIGRGAGGEEEKNGEHGEAGRHQGGGHQGGGHQGGGRGAPRRHGGGLPFAIEMARASARDKSGPPQAPAAASAAIPPWPSLPERARA